MQWKSLWHRIWRSRRGGSTILELLIAFGIITFTIMMPVALFTVNHKANLLEDTLTIGLQAMAVQGGLTDEVADLIYRNMESKGLLPPNSTPEQRAKVKLISNADARGGQIQNLKYREDAAVLELEIRYPASTDVAFINALSRLIGATQAIPGGKNVQWYYVHKGYVLSEKVRW